MGAVDARNVGLAAVVCFASSLALASPGPAQESPTAAVRATINEVFRILDDPKLKDPAKLLPRRHMLEDVIATRFDYAEMSKRSLAAHWVPLSESERAEFVELFKSFLSDRYAEKIEGYSGEQVAYLSERIEGHYAEVRTELHSKKAEIPMDYRLFLKEGGWHAYDIIVDGVSLVKNYRSQFEKIIRADSYQELVRRLRDRTVADDKKPMRSSSSPFFYGIDRRTSDVICPVSGGLGGRNTQEIEVERWGGEHARRYRAGSLNPSKTSTQSSPAL